MSSVHCVVVWEWQCSGQWLPHTPGVTRTLERAHAKKLTRVVLADADPALRGHYVNLRTLTQCLDTSEGGNAECRVRRACYSVTSPAGRGVRWEWARFVSPPLGGELNYEPLPMEVQCLLEESWSGGGETVTFEGWIASVSRMTARSAGVGGAGGVALLRRAPHPPYPLTRPTPPVVPHAPHQHPPPPPERVPLEGRRPRIPQQHTGSSVHSVQSVQSVQSMQSMQSSQSAQASATLARQGARSASPRDRKPGLARQILHNLNIFSHNNKQAAAVAESKHKEELAEEQRQTDTECSSTRSGRRHSVDTVSTYLSHESKESLQQASVGELLNCSGSSDDVFDSPAHAPPHSNTDMPISDGSIVGVDEASSQVCVWVRAAPVPQWGALCPACLAPLAPLAPLASLAPHAAGASSAPAVALTGCQHMLHLHCLNRQLERLRANQEPLYIECLVCGRTYGRPGGAGPRGVRGGRAAARQHGVGAAAARTAAAPALQLLYTRHIQLPVGAAGAHAPGAGRALLRGGLPQALAATRHTARTTGAVGPARGVGARRAVLRVRQRDDGARARGGVARGAPARRAAALRGARAAPARAAPGPGAPARAAAVRANNVR